MQTYWTQGYSSEKADFPKGIEPVAIYLSSEADNLVARLKWEHDSIEGMQRDIKDRLEARIAELESHIRMIAKALDDEGLTQTANALRSKL